MIAILSILKWDRPPGRREGRRAKGGAQKVWEPAGEGPKGGGGPNMSRFLVPSSHHFRFVFSFFFGGGVLSLNYGRGSWPWTTQIVRLGFSGIIT